MGVPLARTQAELTHTQRVFLEEALAFAYTPPLGASDPDESPTTPDDPTPDLRRQVRERRRR